MLGNGSDLRTDGHEIVVTFPSGNEMEVEMIGDPGTGCFSQVETNVDAMGVEPLLEDGAAGGEHLHQTEIFIAAQFGELTEMTPGGEEQVAIGIREAIKKDYGEVVTKEE